MSPFPTLSTDRLFLRQFRLDDVSKVERLAGAREIAAGTLIPHPYPDGMAAHWIEEQRKDFQEGRLLNFAIDLSPDNELIGSIGLTLSPAHGLGELGYWVGVPFWNQGYATEAAAAVLRYGFEHLSLRKIFAPHFASNPSSGRVLQKIGMHHEGCQKAHFLRNGKEEDLELYGLLRSQAGYSE